MADEPDAQGETQKDANTPERSEGKTPERSEGKTPHHGGPYDQTTRRPMGRQTCLVKPVQLNCTIPEGWLIALREYTDKRGMTVTKFVRFAIAELAKAKGITLPPAFAKGVTVNTDAVIEAKRAAKAQPAEGEGA